MRCALRRSDLEERESEVGATELGKDSKEVEGKEREEGRGG